MLVLNMYVESFWSASNFPTHTFKSKRNSHEVMFAFCFLRVPLKLESSEETLDGCDTWPESNVFLIGNMVKEIGESVALPRRWNFLLYIDNCYVELDQTNVHFPFSPIARYECHKGRCTTVKLSWVQTFCQWSNATQANLKGNQL